MRLPAPRGHMSAALITALRSKPLPRPALLVSGGTRDAWLDDDLQLSLWICYELRTHGFDDADPAWEDNSFLAQFHLALEARWEAALRTLTESTQPAALSDEGHAELRKHHAFFRHYHTAGVPGRHEIGEDQELNYPAICRAIRDTGFDGYVAQEFVPTAADPIASLREAVRLCDF